MDAAAGSRLEELRDRLVELRHSIVEEGLTESQTDSIADLAVVHNHPADAGTETFEREKMISILESVDGQLEDVEHALRKLETGGYGVCEACGREIPAERLEAQPAARFCVEDQEAAERAARASS